ncbi:hypothetical protein HWV62_23218 [Athelia sp. TMB]|nr:hypothetical protein HWV62_23218 [Athelia sp. TMB]
MARGEGLSEIGRDLLRGGQLFYFATIGMTLFGACILFFPIQPLFRLILTEPTFALSSALACRVFRNIILRPREPDSFGSADSMRKTNVEVVLTTVIPDEQNSAYWERDIELDPRVHQSSVLSRET